MKALLFDLDDTLVESSALRPAREERDWDAVRTQMPTVPAFEGTAEILRKARGSGCRVAIVTSSPKWYAEYMAHRHGFHVDAIVAWGDYKYGKPAADPIETALKELGVACSSDALAIGDRCIDTASATAAGVCTLGAAWGAANLRDLKLSWPDYLAKNVPEASGVIEAWLSSDRPKPRAWMQGMTAGDVWRTDPVGDNRMHISGAYPYTHARYRYLGNWGTSYTNSLIASFKAKEAKRHYFKKMAAQRFGKELSWIVPTSAYVTYVLPSAKKGDDGYDDRWELLAEVLLESGIRSIWPLQTKETTPPAHTMPADSPYRDPELIKANLEWKAGLPEDCVKLCIVDDVLTKGGHMRAYADFIRNAYPAVSIECIAWALHTSTPWYDPQV
jgi:beta-phosphoglucomutase-like phosphatase (HAD superfamily)